MDYKKLKVINNKIEVTPFEYPENVGLINLPSEEMMDISGRAVVLGKRLLDESKEQILIQILGHAPSIVEAERLTLKPEAGKWQVIYGQRAIGYLEIKYPYEVNGTNGCNVTCNFTPTFNGLV